MKKQILTAALAASMILTINISNVYAAGYENGIVYAFNETEKNFINDALSIGMIENTDYSWNGDVTRLEFCEFAYNMLNQVKELPMAKLARAPFDDISSPKVNALAFVKIINGKGEYEFVPNDKITREEAAVILYRIAEYSGLQLPAVKVDMSYSDNNEISEWAIPAVYSLKVMDVMKNKTEDVFSPQSNYTIGESVEALMKLYNLIKK